MRTVLVTGATGFVGGALVRHLVARGDHVRALVRTAPPRTPLPQAVEQRAGDLRDAPAVRRAVDGADVVFHLGALLHVVDPPASLLPEYDSVNVGGTRNVMDAAASAGVPEVVMASTIDVYGPSDGRTPWTEASPTNPRSIYARTKLAAERVALDGAPSVVLRLATVYGPGMRGNYPRLIDALHRRSFVLVGAGMNRRTLVHLDDVVRTMSSIIELPQAGGHCFNVTDGTTPTMREILAAICAHMGRRPPRLRFPTGPMLAVVRAAERGSRALGQSPAITQASIEKLTEDLAVSNERIATESGLRPTVELSEGWRPVIARLTA